MAMQSDPGSGQRVAALRAELLRVGVDAVIVPRADEHLGEYVPARAERLAWLTGFTGSAGLAAVTLDRAAVFSDGRYVLQLASQTDPTVWERRHMIEEPAAVWLRGAGAGRVGYDPWLIAEDALKPFQEAGLVMVPLDANPVDAIWPDQPAPPLAPAVPHPLTFAGVASADKQSEIAGLLHKAGQDAAVISDPASIAWLFNIRGTDVPNTPFALGFALVGSDGTATLFMDAVKLPPDTRAWLGNRVALAERAALPRALAALGGKSVRVDPVTTPSWFARTLRDAGATVVAGADPCLLPKACKNQVEQQGARTAHGVDAVAVCRFLHWLDQASGETELSAAARLLALRAEQPGFRGESFPAISGAGENGAIIHYRVTTSSNRQIGLNETYLIDSGAQYLAGTTDITRTIWTGPGPADDLVADRFTRVLKGHIAIATLVFPQGVCGAHLDSFARQALWQVGLDYDHGTGHGVGSYLSVHEGPVSLSRAARMVPLASGMILSNEPGFYAPGAFGIRIENLLLVEPRSFAGATRAFMGFETLTLAPIDRRLICTALLTESEIAWIDAYHARVLAEVAPHLPGDVASWLRQACRVLS
jgi:Xaa-Pro aminopeptidase